MQLRRHLPLILLLLILIALGGLYGTSYIYVPEPTQQETTEEISPSKLAPATAVDQPAEYP